MRIFALLITLFWSSTALGQHLTPPQSSSFGFDIVRPLESSARAEELLKQVAAPSRTPLLSQGDPRWKDVQYAPKATFGKFGCLVMSLLMVYNEREKVSISPLSFASILKRFGLVTANGRLYWGKPIGKTTLVPRALNIGGRAAIEEAKRQQAIGKAVIIEVQKPRSRHWMLLYRIGDVVTTIDTDGGVIRDLAHYGGIKNITRIAIV